MIQIHEKLRPNIDIRFFCGKSANLTDLIDYIELNSLVYNYDVKINLRKRKLNLPDNY